MTLPTSSTAQWIDLLDDEQLRAAEVELAGEYRREELAERERRGDAYELLRGPATLMRAWMRWTMVRNATEERTRVRRQLRS